VRLATKVPSMSIAATVVAAAVAASVVLLAPPSQAFGGQPISPTAGAVRSEPDPGVSRMARLSFVFAGQPVLDGSVIPAGSDLQIRNVPAGASVVLRTLDRPSLELALTQSPRDRRIWIARELPPSTRLWAKVVDPSGEERRLRFRTAAPLGRFTASISPERGTYGIGIPVEIDFSMPIVNKAAVEASLEVVSDKDLGPTSWSWLDDDTIAFRPKNYWPGNAKISVRARLADVQGSPGYYGTDAVRHFAIGTARIIKTRIADYTMTVWEDGTKIAAYPISSGKPGWETASGIKIVTEKYRVKRLWNPDPKVGWDVTVPWAIRITWNGEFIHSADWNYSIGSANLSHGCTNMTVADAAELFAMVRIGDVVEATGSGVAVNPARVSGEWNTPWQHFRAGSALD
jgi:lipoprotein-anchoring transpeptidase ErfK/SrfK